MSAEAWNKITKTHDLFKKIIAPLKEHLGINFGYMIVFNDGRYYQIIEDLECLKKWVTNVETSHIFCARNVTTYFDEPYNFTIWPEEPTCPAMEIYKEHGMWNGITVSKVNKDYTELYWFTKQNAENGWHKWFIRNKQFLLNFIKYFINCKSNLHLSDNNYAALKLNQKFNNELIESEYIKKEFLLLDKTESLLKLNHIVEDFRIKTLSEREKEVLAIICRGYTTKAVALELNVGQRTINTYIERIKIKTGLHFKIELIQFYEQYLLKQY